MTLYCLSGLGVDSRVFKHLVFPSDLKVEHIEWITPTKNESLNEYAKRLSTKIDSKNPFILLGLSFGGIVAIEISRFLRPEKIILLSSIARRQELPFHLKIANKLKLNKLIPEKMIYHPGFLTYWIFGISEPNDKKLLSEILFASNRKFSKWAVNEILNWKRKEIPENIIRIHGDSDRVLPIKNFRPNYIVKGGGHFMVVNRSAEISKTLKLIIG